MMSRNGMGWRSVVLLCLPVAALTGCGGGASHALVFSDDPEGSFGVTMPNIARGAPFTLVGMNLCVRGPAPVELVSVEPKITDGLRVSRFALHPRTPGWSALGTGVDLEAAGFDPENHTVRSACSPKGSDPMTSQPHDDFGVEFVRTRETTGTVQGLVVTYRDADGRAGALTINATLTLCDAADRTTPDCVDVQS